MNFLWSIVVGCQLGAAVYLILSGHIVRVVFGVMLLGLAVNSFIFSASGLVSLGPALIESDQVTLANGRSDPLPQALVLTAIVIGFGVQVFLIGLLMRLLPLTGGESERFLTTSEQPSDQFHTPRSLKEQVIAEERTVSFHKVSQRPEQGSSPWGEV